MKNLKIVKLLFVKFSHLWDRNFKFNSFINIFSLMINSFSISLIILIITINNGFKKNTFEIIEDLSGISKIYNYNNSQLDNSDFNVLHKTDHTLSKIVQDKCIIKHNGISQSILVESLDVNESRFENLSKYFIEGQLNDSSIVIGKILYEKLNINIYDSVSLITIDQANKINVDNYTISGVFQTDFLNFDSYVVFKNINPDVRFFDFFSSSKQKKLLSNTIQDKYVIYSMEENNSSFINWLRSYDNPLKALILFILVISSINIINNNYYLLFNKKNQIESLMILGLKKNILRYILLLRSFFMAVLSIFFGSIIGYGLLYIEKNYHFITIPEYVYFTKFIPMDINLNALYIAVPYLIVISFISMLITYEIKINK